MLLYQVSGRGLGPSAKSFVAVCFISLALMLFDLPDEPSLPRSIEGHQLSSAGEDDVADDDSQDEHLAIPSRTALCVDRVLVKAHGADPGVRDAIDTSQGISPRGPPRRVWAS
jgi:hypothetical protein